MGFDWTNKTALVTGASSGIGRALSVELARRGARLGLLARRADALQGALREIESGGGRATALVADVRDVGAVRRAVESLRQAFGPIDLLIANAGIGDETPATKFDLARATEIVSINLIGAMNCVGAVLPEMVARSEGYLVAISSLAAYRGLPRSAAYSASKAGLSTFFESLRVDLQGTGVAVTVIHPGFIRTPMIAQRRAPVPYLLDLPEAIERIVAAIEKRKRSCAFPWQLAATVKLLALMPAPLYDLLMARTQKARRR